MRGWQCLNFYLSQSLHVRAPMYVETDYTVSLEVMFLQRHRAVIATWICDAARKVTLEGEAEVMNRERIPGSSGSKTSG